MKKKAIRIGIIGTGGMAGAHAGNFNKIKDVAIVACCDVSRERAENFAKKWNIPGIYTDYNVMLKAEELDGIANVTPDAMHAKISLDVIKHGIAILCEKPLATTLADAKKMAAAANAKKVINLVNFSYRNSSGLQHAARFIAQGGLGRIIHVESSYLQSWLSSCIWGDWKKNPGLAWRLSTAHGSAGVLGDIGCHIYDLTTLLCGDISKIFCTLKTFDKGVKGNKLGEYVLDANDSFVANVEFKNGAIGTIHSSRWATGHANSLRCRVYGDKGALEIDLDTAYDQYRVVSGKDTASANWKVIKCKPTPSNYERFITSIKTGKNDPSDFINGTKIQAYLHASLLSDTQKKAVTVSI